MIKLPQVLTAGGTATLVFELHDKRGQRLSDIPSGVARVSIRKLSTSRLVHELPLMNASMDHALATVTLDLSGRDTQAIGPSETLTQEGDILAIADVRIISADAIDYYGPYEFRVRTPETYTAPGTGPVVSRIDITGIGETSATATLTIENHDGTSVYLRWKDTEDSAFGVALSAVADSPSVVFAITGLEGGRSYQVRASFDSAFTMGVEAARFDTVHAIPQRRYSFWTTPYTQDGQQGAIPTEAAILAQGPGARTDDLEIRTPINIVDSFIAGYIWYFMPREAMHYSSGGPFNFNQFGVLLQPGMVTIDGWEYWVYVNPNGLNPIITQAAVPQYIY